MRVNDFCKKVGQVGQVVSGLKTVREHLEQLKKDLENDAG